jgi:hypothetical protein
VTAKSLAKLALFLALCFGIGFVAGRSPQSSIPTWYAGLIKPPGTPPN